MINLEPSIAVTQNFVGRHELKTVLEFMRDRPAQLSGFGRCCGGTDDVDDGRDAGEGVFEAFCAALERHGQGELVRTALAEDVTAKPSEPTLWQTVRPETASGAFSFGFALEDED